MRSSIAVLVAQGRDCDTAARDDAIARAAEGLGRAVVRVCGGTSLETLGFPASCSDPDGGLFSAENLRACLLAAVEAQVDMALMIEFPLAMPATGRGPLRCQLTIGRQGARFLQGKVRARSRCLDLQRNGNVASGADCRAEVPPSGPGTGNADTDTSIAKLQSRLASELRRQCSNVTLAALGFPGACPDNTGGSFTVGDLQDCIRDTHEAKADAIIAVAYPSGAPVPTATPPQNETPTPSVTSSPVSTSSPAPSETVSAATPSASPTPGGACGLPNPLPAELSIIAKPGIDLDTGWTGQSHDLLGVDNASLTTVRVIDCDTNTESPTCGQCDIEGPLQFPGSSKNCLCFNLGDRDASSLAACDPEMPSTCSGAETCQCFYGPPLPLSSGATPVCVVNRYTAAVSGTANIADAGPHAGETEAVLRLESAVHNGVTVDRPCPTCVNDIAPIDGVKDGTCDEGAKKGQPCDVSGTNVFFGDVSFDCPPGQAASIGNLNIRFNPATTGTTTLGTNGLSCTAPGFTAMPCFCDTCATAAAEACNSNADCPAGIVCGGRRCIGGANAGAQCTVTSECGPISSCNRPGQATAPNACNDAVCTPDASDPSSPNDGVCEAGPFDRLCSLDTFRGCLLDADCNPPPLGSCANCVPGQSCGGLLRQCFLDPIIRTGMPGTQMSVIAATFCISPTSAPAVNSVAGFPGPGAVLLPVQIVRSAATCGNGVIDAGETCDPPAASNCAAGCLADCSCAPVCGDNVVNQASEQCDGTDAGTCTGACQPDCTCAPVCGNGVREGAEELTPPTRRRVPVPVRAIAPAVRSAATTPSTPARSATAPARPRVRRPHASPIACAVRFAATT